MPDNPKSAPDQKEKTKEKMNDWPRLDETLSLRECAKRISASRSGNPESLDPNLLLQELKIGSLSAGFHLPTDPLIWIEIPAQHWIGVTKDQFESIRRKSGSKTKTGNFTVDLSDFLDQYIEARIRTFGSINEGIDKNWLRDLTSEFYRQADKSFDVVVSGESWREFESSNNIQEAFNSVSSAADLSVGRAEHKGKQGRKPLEGWKELYECLAIYLIRSVPDSVTADAIASAVFEKIDQVYPGKISGVPKQSSFEKAILRIREKAREIY